MDIPQSPEAWYALEDDQLFSIALSGHSGVAEHEISRRFIVALRQFQESADTASATLVRLQWFLIGLTAAILVLTGVIVWDIFQR
jgi:hypothetical protein